MNRGKSTFRWNFFLIKSISSRRRKTHRKTISASVFAVNYHPFPSFPAAPTHARIIINSCPRGDRLSLVLIRKILFAPFPFASRSGKCVRREIPGEGRKQSHRQQPFHVSGKSCLDRQTKGADEDIVEFRPKTYVVMLTPRKHNTPLRLNVYRKFQPIRSFVTSKTG